MLLPGEDDVPLPDHSKKTNIPDAVTVNSSAAEMASSDPEIDAIARQPGEDDVPLPASSDRNASPDESPEPSDVHETSCPMVSCLQPEDVTQYVADHIENKVYSVAPGERQTPCSTFEIETKVFPYYLPDGTNGFTTERQHKLGMNRYFNARLFSADPRFASDPQYIFYSQYMSDVNQIRSSVSIAVRKGSPATTTGHQVTAAMLKDKESREKLLKSDKGYRFRGTPAYWEKTLRDLFAMVRQLGTPTWFCSFSAAERRWPEICNAICKQQGKAVPMDMDWFTHCQIINSNPVTACRMFENRVQNFITNVMSPGHPISNVTDYFFRTEFQSRGWPHVHCLFWCDDAPKYTPESDKEFLDFVDKYVSCSMPDEHDNPDLHEVINYVQMHSKSHSRSCKKGPKVCKDLSGRTIFTSRCYIT